MAELTLSPPPGTYSTPQTVNVTGPSNISGVVVTTDGNDPVVVKTVVSSDKYAPSEYPYVQTIEDGRGRAIFDGAFTKYYNRWWVDASNASGNPTNFTQLAPSFKILYNSLNFLRKDGIGTRLLVLGDKYSGSDSGGSDNYIASHFIDDPMGTTGWATSMHGIASLMGFSITIKTSQDYAGNMLDPTFAECMNYDIIFLFSSTVMQPPNTSRKFLTPEGAANIAQARRNGVGIYICTDNGGGPSGDGTVRYPESFYATANILVGAMTNANFQGNMDFSPGTTVGYNKAKWGDSPLFANLNDSDIMAASDSDSFVNQAVSNPSPLPTTVDIPEGYTSVKFAIIHTDGSVSFEQYGYNVGQPPVVELCDENGNTITEWPQTNLKARTVYFKYIPGAFGPATGFVTVNGVTVGSFQGVTGGIIPITYEDTPYSSASEPNVIKMPGSSDFPVLVELNLPIVFTYVWPFDRFVPGPPRDLGSFVASINRNEFASPIPGGAAVVLTKAESLLGIAQELSPARACQSIFTNMTT